MGEILDLAEALWQGTADTYTYHPLGRPHGIEQIADQTWFHKGLACTVIRETDEGLIIVDPAAYFDVEDKFKAVRTVSRARLHTAIYTHGHVDHAFGVPRYAKEARANGWPLPQAVAHQAILPRFQRYLATVGWNAIINLRQFRGGVGERMWPVEYLPPDTTYADRLTIQVGGVSARLQHARGETDDHTWIFFPDTRVLCPGDLFIWAVPNAGNPQKVQRYAREWALALREMAALNAAVLAPGHGVPIFGEDRVREALENTATLLESLHEQTLALMNQGASLDSVIQAVQAPEELLALPYLHPVYDEPEFIVRNIWRFYGGWYDGVPSNLKPAPEQARAEEIARLAGGAERLAARAEELVAQGDLRLACHLADWARLAAPQDPGVGKVVQGIYEQRAEAEQSTMAMGIYRTAANEAGASASEGPAGGVLQAQTRRAKKTAGT